MSFERDVRTCNGLQLTTYIERRWILLFLTEPRGKVKHLRYPKCDARVSLVVDRRPSVNYA